MMLCRFPDLIAGRLIILVYMLAHGFHVLGKKHILDIDQGIDLQGAEGVEVAGTFAILITAGHDGKTG